MFLECSSIKISCKQNLIFIFSKNWKTNEIMIRKIHRFLNQIYTVVRNIIWSIHVVNCPTIDVGGISDQLLETPMSNLITQNISCRFTIKISNYKLLSSHIHHFTEGRQKQNLPRLCVVRWSVNTNNVIIVTS